MSSTLHSKKLIFVFVLIIIAVEILVRLFPVMYLEKPEKFLISYIREKIESGNNRYDIIILGDSRSMSFQPAGYTNIYNFSLPAMGTRYYIHFVKKYIKHNPKPKAIVFSGSPVLVHSGKGNPLVDQKVADYVYPDMPLWEYLYVRTVKRILNIRQEFENTARHYNEEFWWEFFSHRFLFLFSTSEISGIYRGPEWFFVVSQSIPLNYRTFKHREALQNLFSYHTFLFEENYFGNPPCTCETLFEPQCQPPKSNFQDNLTTKKNLEKYNGYYNISDRISGEKLLQWELQRKELRDRQMLVANSEPEMDFSVTVEFLEYLYQQKILYIYLTAPFPEYFRDGKYLKKFYREFQLVVDKYPHATIMHLPTPFYEEELFSDQVHLNCFGARRLNEEYRKSVLPGIQEYVRSKYRELFEEKKEK